MTETPSTQTAPAADKPFEREYRYYLLKVSDMHKYLDDEQMDVLTHIANEVAERRELDGKPPLRAVVVESDWPEFEPTWDAIADRVGREAVGD